MTVDIYLPTLHPGQLEAFMLPARFEAVRCGRRWGKTEMGITEACDALIKGQSVGWFAPDYKIMSEAYDALIDVIEPIKTQSSKQAGKIRVSTGGVIDWWSLENDRAGRSRRYHLIVIDEGAFTKKNMMDIWRKSIRPTLVDFKGRALVLSNTNGTDPDNFLWRICNEPEHGFKEYHAPSSQNPYLPAEELERLRAESHPLVFQQEYLAEFVDWSGVQFFALDNMLVEGQPVAFPLKCDSVFAVIDTAVKTGKEHDSTAVSFFARTKHAVPKIGLHPLVLLDWDIIQVEGAMLEKWLPSVFQRLEELARLTQARNGSLGAWIEDASSGQILLQQGRNRGWPVHPIDSKLTAAGKDERAFNASGYVYRGMLKISMHAYDKTKVHKEKSRNHWIQQVLGFRIGAADGQSDDLLDTMTNGVAIGLGNQEGY